MKAQLVALLFVASPVLGMEYLKPPTDQRGGYRVPGVVTKGGKTIYLSGQTGERDPSGKMLSGNAEAQTRQVFSNIDLALKQAGASLENLAALTIYIKDEKDRAVVAKVRDAMFRDGHYPASTFLLLSWHPQPEALVYMTGIAVVE